MLGRGPWPVQGHTKERERERERKGRIHIHRYPYLHTSVCMYICMHMCIYIYIKTYIHHMCLCMHTSLYIYTYMYTDIYACIYIYIFIYICIHAYNGLLSLAKDHIWVGVAALLTPASSLQQGGLGVPGSGGTIDGRDWGAHETTTAVPRPALPLLAAAVSTVAYGVLMIVAPCCEGPRILNVACPDPMSFFAGPSVWFMAVWKTRDGQTKRSYPTIRTSPAICGTFMAHDAVELCLASLPIVCETLEHYSGGPVWNTAQGTSP